jgi:choline dehydrogenase-like flavoprotein
MVRKLTISGIPLIQESPYVGKNLYDHFAIYMAFRLKDPSRGLALGSPGFSNPSFFKGLPYDWVESETVPETVLSKHVNGHRELQDKGKRNLFEVLTVYVPPGIPGIPIDGTHLATSTMLLLPSSRGTVSLNTANPADAPEIQPNYLNSDLDKDTLVHATRRTLQAILGTKALADYVEGETPPSGEGIPELAPLTLESSDDDILDRIRKTGKQHHHSGGTAAMGTVVDTDAKVLGVEKLRVIDASIVPVPLGGHPQATLYAMAELLAEVVIRDGNL